MFDSATLAAIRQQFPALKRTHNGKPVIYLDGPGGTQPVESAIEAMAAYMRGGVANVHGQFPTSIETDAMIAASREAMADMLGCAPDEVAYGANATSLIFAVSRALSRQWKAGDEIIVCETDHRANVDPWLLAAADRGVVVRWLPCDPHTLCLDYDLLDTLITPKTRLVALGYASNAVGTINNVSLVARKAHAVGALMAVDAVHIAPHIGISMADLDADMLFCSVYKFFGGHMGVAAVRRNLFENLESYRLAPASSATPDKLETGTKAHEALASIVPALEFVASLGNGNSRRERILSGFNRIERHENALAETARKGLAAMPFVRLWQAPADCSKTATIAFTISARAPRDVCRHAADAWGVFLADGDFYSSTLAEKLGLCASGGWIRAGMAPYNTPEEVEIFLEAINSVK